MQVCIRYRNENASVSMAVQTERRADLARAMLRCS